MASNLEYPYNLFSDMKLTKGDTMSMPSSLAELEFQHTLMKGRYFDLLQKMSSMIDQKKKTIERINFLKQDIIQLEREEDQLKQKQKLIHDESLSRDISKSSSLHLESNNNQLNFKDELTFDHKVNDNDDTTEVQRSELMDKLLLSEKSIHELANVLEEKETQIIHSKLRQTQLEEELKQIEDNTAILATKINDGIKEKEQTYYDLQRLEKELEILNEAYQKRIEEKKEVLKTFDDLNNDITSVNKMIENLRIDQDISQKKLQQITKHQDNLLQMEFLSNEKIEEECYDNLCMPPPEHYNVFFNNELFKNEDLKENYYKDVKSKLLSLSNKEVKDTNDLIKPPVIITEQEQIQQELLNEDILIDKEKSLSLKDIHQIEMVEETENTNQLDMNTIVTGPIQEDIALEKEEAGEKEALNQQDTNTEFYKAALDSKENNDFISLQTLPLTNVKHVQNFGEPIPIVAPLSMAQNYDELQDVSEITESTSHEELIESATTSSEPEAITRYLETKPSLKTSNERETTIMDDTCGITQVSKELLVEPCEMFEESLLKIKSLVPIDLKEKDVVSQHESMDDFVNKFDSQKNEKKQNDSQSSCIDDDITGATSPLENNILQQQKDYCIKEINSESNDSYDVHSIENELNTSTQPCNETATEKYGLRKRKTLNNFPVLILSYREPKKVKPILKDFCTASESLPSETSASKTKDIEVERRELYEASKTAMHITLSDDESIPCSIEGTDMQNLKYELKALESSVETAMASQEETLQSLDTLEEAMESLEKRKTQTLDKYRSISDQLKRLQSEVGTPMFEYNEKDIMDIASSSTSLNEIGSVLENKEGQLYNAASTIENDNVLAPSNNNNEAVIQTKVLKLFETTEGIQEVSLLKDKTHSGIASQKDMLLEEDQLLGESTLSEPRNDEILHENHKVTRITDVVDVPFPPKDELPPLKEIAKSPATTEEVDESLLLSDETQSEVVSQKSVLQEEDQLLNNNKRGSFTETRNQKTSEENFDIPTIQSCSLNDTEGVDTPYSDESENLSSSAYSNANNASDVTATLDDRMPPVLTNVKNFQTQDYMALQDSFENVKVPEKPTGTSGDSALGNVEFSGMDDSTTESVPESVIEEEEAFKTNKQAVKVLPENVQTFDSPPSPKLSSIISNLSSTAALNDLPQLRDALIRAQKAITDLENQLASERNLSAQLTAKLSGPREISDDILDVLQDEEKREALTTASSEDGDGSKHVQNLHSQNSLDLPESENRFAEGLKNEDTVEEPGVDLPLLIHKTPSFENATIALTEEEGPSETNVQDGRIIRAPALLFLCFLFALSVFDILSENVSLLDYAVVAAFVTRCLHYVTSAYASSKER